MAAELVKITNPKNQYYAIIKAHQGDSRFIVSLLNGDEVKATLRGYLKIRNKNNIIHPGDFVLIEKSSINIIKPTYYILVKYNRNERDKLRNMGENVDSLNEEINDIYTDNTNELNIDDI
jgi:translation initiation factor IF-1